MSATNAYSIRSLFHVYDGAVALDVPHLDIPGGEIWGLVGPNGAGKTTLLSILALLLKQSAGSVYVHGTEVTADRMRRLRRKVTLLHQKPVLFTRSVRKNISYGLHASGFSSKEIADRVEAIIVDAGLESVAGRQPRTLSGGETQRVALARGLVLETPILLLDEPTNSLDDAFRPLLLQMLRKANQSRKTTILAATHDIGFISAIADRIVQMEAGKLIT